MIFKSFLTFLVLAGFVTFQPAGGENVDDLINQNLETFFETQMLKYLAEKSPQKNLVVSTRNLKVILGLLSLGTGGNTAKELRQALRLPLDDPLAKQELKNLSNIHKDNEGVQVKMANQLLIAPDITVKGSFEQLIRNDFPTTNIRTGDFSSPESLAKEINEWISSTTNGLIPNLVDSSSFTRETIIALLSAVFFKGEWKTKFNENLTKPGCFYRRAGVCENVPMMKGKAWSVYIGSLDANIFELPYRDDVHSMIVVLPEEPEGLERLITLGTYTPYSRVLEYLESAGIEVDFEMPKFSLDYTFDAVDFFKKAHVKEIFSGGNFTLMLDALEKSINVTNIHHKAKIEVDERGATAAATTVVLGGLNSFPIILEYTVDHPFLFFIRNKETGIIFEGVVYKPDGIAD